MALLAALGLGGCGGGVDAAARDAAADQRTAPTAADRLAYAPCEAAARVGLFTVALEDEYTAVDGRVASGVVPANVREVTGSEGACRLLEGRALHCDPPCGVGETCGEDGDCIAYPEVVGVGEVSVSGLSVPLVMRPNTIGAYSNGATAIPHPGFEAGDEIALVAAGDALPGFALAGRGVAPLETSARTLTLAMGEDLRVGWTSGGEPSARMRMTLDLAHHGGIAASIECDGVADDGAFEVPARLVERLVAIGVAGFPTLTIARRTADSVVVASGCVELAVQAGRVLDVVVPGVRSCLDDSACEPGEVCGGDLVCR